MLRNASRHVFGHGREQRLLLAAWPEHGGAGRPLFSRSSLSQRSRQSQFRLPCYCASHPLFHFVAGNATTTGSRIRNAAAQGLVTRSMFLPTHHISCNARSARNHSLRTGLHVWVRHRRYHATPSLVIAMPQRRSQRLAVTTVARCLASRLACLLVKLELCKPRPEAL